MPSVFALCEILMRNFDRRYQALDSIDHDGFGEIE